MLSSIAETVISTLQKNIATFLSQAYPFYYRGKELVVITFLLFLMTLMFGYVFEPFEVYHPEHKMDYFWITCVHACTPVFVVLLFLPLKKLYADTEQWTVKKEILLIAAFLLIVGLFQFLIRDLIYDNPNNWSLRYLIEEIRNTFLVGILFAFILVPLNHQRLSTRNSKKARTFNNVKTSPQADKNQSSYSNELEIDITTLMYAKAEGNYIALYVNSGKKILIRLTMKRLETILKGHPHFTKTHRSYLVNTAYIDAVSGNAQGYKLKLKNTSDIVPVSRQMMDSFDKKMAT